MPQEKIENAEVREAVERAKRDHVHKWGLITDGPDCDTCDYSATLGLAYCKCGETIGPTEVERRLDATERLSAEDAREISSEVHSAWWPLEGESPYEDGLRAYAVAREAE